MAAKRNWTEDLENYIKKRLCEDKIKLYVLAEELRIDYSTLRNKVKLMEISYISKVENTLESNFERNAQPLPAGDWRTWDLICPGIEFPDPYKCF